jgi:hypothetical protein
MSNYIVKTEAKPLFEEEMVEDIKVNIENFYLNARDNDHIGFCVFMKWHEFAEIIKQMRLDTATINMLPDKIHQMRTLNNGIISIICQNDLTEDYMMNRFMCLKGLQFTQVCIIGLEQLNGWLVSNICSRVKVRI